MTDWPEYSPGELEDLKAAFYIPGAREVARLAAARALCVPVGAVSVWIKAHVDGGWVVEVVASEVDQRRHAVKEFRVPSSALKTPSEMATTAYWEMRGAPCPSS